MSLNFYPLFHNQSGVNPLSAIQNGRGLLKDNSQVNTLIISLIDLKPQQLPIPHRKFIFHPQNSSVIVQTKPTTLDKDQQQVYSNIEWMLWVSQPIKMHNIHWLSRENQRNNNNHQQLPQNKSNVFVRYVYLPPLAEYMKHYAQRLKNVNQLMTSNHSHGSVSSVSSSINGNTPNHLSHQTQLVIEQRHQVMYCLARELSSGVVYDFGSKYIRFDHSTFQDYHNSVFQKGTIQNYASTNMNQGKKMGQEQTIPYYVVIKSNSYSSQRDFEVYRVKLSSNKSQTGSNGSVGSLLNNQRSSVNISMEIESKSVMGVRKLNNMTQNKSVLKELTQVSDKLLRLSQNRLNKELKEGTLNNKAITQNDTQSESMSKISTENSLLIDNQIRNNSQQGQSLKSRQQLKQQTEDNQDIQISKQSAQWLKPIQYGLFMPILMHFCKKPNYNQNQTKRSDKTISKGIVEDALFYYENSKDMMGKLQLQKSQGNLQVKKGVLEGILRNFLSQRKGEYQSSLSHLQNQLMKDYPQNQLMRVDPQNQLIKEQLSFELIEELEDFMARYLGEQVLIRYIPQQELISVNSKPKRLSEVVQIINRKNSLIIPQIQIQFIEQLQCNLREFIESHLIQLMRNQYLSLIHTQSVSFNQLNNQPIDCQLNLQLKQNTTTDVTNNTNHQSDVTKNINAMVPILNVQIPVKVKKNLSQRLYQTLSYKLSCYRINYSKYLPLIFSYPLQVQFLKTTITDKNTKIHNLHQQIAILQLELKQKQSVIQNRQTQIHKYKLDQTFYQQVLKELNHVQSQLNEQTQLKKKLIIDLQCSQIVNIQANQTIKTYQIKQSRLMQQKQNFLQAISHLSKENLHYITLCQQLQSTISSLDKKIDHYHMVDLQINALNLQNSQFKCQVQSIRTWKQAIQQEHKELLMKQASKFNEVLRMNFKKFNQLKQSSKESVKLVEELTDQLQLSTKNCSLLQEQIHYLKSKYFNMLNPLLIHYPHNNNYHQQNLNLSVSNP